MPTHQLQADDKVDEDCPGNVKATKTFIKIEMSKKMTKLLQPARQETAEVGQHEREEIIHKIKHRMSQCAGAGKPDPAAHHHGDDHG